jgi:hypothetical protein
VIGFRIKIIGSAQETYWYNDHIDEEYWAYLDEDQKNYVIIPEGAINRANSEFKRTIKDFGDKVVIAEDCYVLKMSHIMVDTTTMSKIVDVGIALF